MNVLERMLFCRMPSRDAMSVQIRFEFSGASLGSGRPEPVGVSETRRKPAQRQLASPTPSLATPTTYEKGV